MRPDGDLRLVSAEEIDCVLDFPRLVAALRTAFAGGLTAPARHHHEIGPNHQAMHLLMPAWTTDTPGPDAYLGTKIVNVFRGNAALGLPAVLGSYLLQSGASGAPIALMDGTRLTHWRTAAASALAADYLARPDSRHLLVVGAGALAPFLVRAHAAVRPIERVTVWNHRRAGAEALAGRLDGLGFSVVVADDLAPAVAAADVVSCATLSTAPLVLGRWLLPGQHIDLVGAFTFAMREADDEALRRASVFVDTEDAQHEGGDVAIALRDRVLAPADIRGTLHALCSGQAAGRTARSELTLFKSTGAAIEDLAAAMLVWTSLDRT